MSKVSRNIVKMVTQNLFQNVCFTLNFYKKNDHIKINLIPTVFHQIVLNNIGREIRPIF